MSFASRYSAGHFIYPSPFRDPDGFVSCLLDHIERLNARVLIPVFEETFLVSKFKHLFASRVGIAVPDYDDILMVHNKDRCEELAGRLGIPVPRSCPASTARCAGGAAALRYPVLLKPKQGGGSWGIRQAETPQELDALLAQPDWMGRPWERFFVQEKIAGDTHCVAMLFSHGQWRATVGYRQLRDYPARGGQATLRVSARHEAAEASLRQLLEELGWHGPCQADFIVDSETNVPYLIDINPRLWGSLAQAIASGVDFPHLIYQLALEGDVRPVPTFKTGVVTRWIGGEMAALPSRLRSSTERLRLLQDFVAPSRRAVLYDDLAITDPLPFMLWALDAAHRAFKFKSVAAVSHDSLDGVWE
jgi:predicted ATP-grasp superfamily ATP-dependent carboligase